MPFNPEEHHRRSIRLKDYDYSQPGSYFITICTHNHVNLFGNIVSIRVGLEPARTKTSTTTPSTPVGITTTLIGSLEQSNKQILFHENEFSSSEEYSMDLNEYGKIVHLTWNNLVNYNSGIRLGEFVIMPNHIHTIIHILDPENDSDDFIPSNFIFADDKPKSLPLNSEKTGSVEVDSLRADSERAGFVRAGFVRAGSKPAPENNQKQNPLSEIIRQFKTFSSRKINQARKSPGFPVWKRDYYEHIIRDQESYDRIVEYIHKNPMM